jgi:Na+/phosphate symporter
MVKVTDENISMMRKIIADQNKETAETLEKNKKKRRRKDCQFSMRRVF